MTEVAAGSSSESQAPSRESRVRSAALAIAARVKGNHLTPGEVAELRRMSGSVGGPAFWRLAALDLEPRGLLAAEAETRWQVATCLIAILGELHDPRVSLGRALAAATLSEARLFRLLRSTGAPLDDAARIATRYLATEGKAANAADLAELVVRPPETKRGQALRRTIARDFYRHHTATNPPTPGDEP
jgi:CRISPR type I-E-associated protein CasB/Cse2